MKVTNVNPDPEGVYLAGYGEVGHGETIDVDTDLGKSLCTQTRNWVKAKAEPETKAAAAGKGGE